MLERSDERTQRLHDCLFARQRLCAYRLPIGEFKRHIVREKLQPPVETRNHISDVRPHQVFYRSRLSFTAAHLALLCFFPSTAARQYEAGDCELRLVPTACCIAKYAKVMAGPNVTPGPGKERPTTAAVQFPAA